jgi:uncharacterized protein YceH (UPF0502 family)
MELSFDERRVAGTLIEKGYTTPEQYPLTMNALVTGSNQKSCRNPVTQLDEERVFLALDGLRKKGLCTLVQMQTSRTDRWKHRFSDTLALEPPEIAILGELLLRGPQTVGELHQHASRMTRLESSEATEAAIAKLMAQAPPLALRLTAEGRKRGVRFAHNLYAPTELEELKRAEAAAASALPAETPGEKLSAAGGGGGGGGASRHEVETLRQEVAALAARVTKLEEALGGPG